MPKFSLKDILHRLGGPEHFQRVLGLQAQIVKRSANAVAARVGAPFESIMFDVMVSSELEGRCPCTIAAQGSFCDHAGAAALEWILEGSDHGELPGSRSKAKPESPGAGAVSGAFERTPIGRFS